jgi:hypothetical protein
MKSFFYGTLLISVVAVSLCPAAPEPAIVPAPGDWTLETEFTHPQQIVLQRKSDKKPVWFWYTILTLTNDAGDDVTFYPQCDLMTDTLRIIQAGKSVSPMVFAEIKERHKSRYPFLERLSKSGSRILQGEDNTRDIAVIWSDFDANAKDIKIFIEGLSNETAAIEHPTAKDDTGNPQRIFLRKTLELSYGVKGDPAIRSGVSLSFKGKRWIMR